jgi:hypothetical protein
MKYVIDRSTMKPLYVHQRRNETRDESINRVFNEIGTFNAILNYTAVDSECCPVKTRIVLRINEFFIKRSMKKLYDDLDYYVNQAKNGNCYTVKEHSKFYSIIKYHLLWCNNNYSTVMNIDLQQETRYYTFTIQPDVMNNIINYIRNEMES